MKIETNKNGEIILKEVYLGVGLESNNKEFFGICMRDTGFEFNYNGEWYEAKKGEIKKLVGKPKSSDELPTTNGVEQSEQLKEEVFTLANKLALAGEGNAAVSMHRIHNRL